MLAARAAGAGKTGDGDRPLVEIAIGCQEDAMTVDRRHVGNFDATGQSKTEVPRSRCGTREARHGAKFPARKQHAQPLSVLAGTTTMVSPRAVGNVSKEPRISSDLLLFR